MVHVWAEHVRTIGVDLAGILGGRIVRAEGGLVPRIPSGVGYAEGVPSSAD